MKYAYPAIFAFNGEENMYRVKFPDIENCSTEGKDLLDAVEKAKDALCLILYGVEERGSDIPAASDIRTVACSGEEFATMIVCDTLVYRARFDNALVERTLVVPRWLSVMAERKGADFSVILQKGLMKFCGIDEDNAER